MINPLVASALSGYELGIGMHLLGMSSVLLLTFFTYYFITSKNASSTTKKYAKWALISFLSLVFMSIVFQYVGIRGLFTDATSEKLRPKIEIEVSKMGKAFIEGDYQTFADFNHPRMIESMGGRKSMIDIINSSAVAFNQSGIRIKEISLNEIIDIQKSRNDIQVLMTQNMILENQGKEIVELQRLIGVSEDNADTWHFVNITNKTKDQVISIFPDLNQNFTFQ
jgi:hypothetical protein